MHKREAKSRTPKRRKPIRSRRALKRRTVRVSEKMNFKWGMSRLFPVIHPPAMTAADLDRLAMLRTRPFPDSRVMLVSNPEKGRLYQPSYSRQPMG